MGNCGSSPEASASSAQMGQVTSFSEQEDAERRSRALDKELKDLQCRLDSEIKILLLGAGESGKTTVLKQMKVIHAIGFSTEELEEYRKQVFRNLWDGMRTLLEAMQELELRLSSEQNRDYLYLFEDMPHLADGQAYPLEFKRPLQELWSDAGVQSVTQRWSEVVLPDSLSYFFSDIDRIFHPEFIPTYDDIFRVRAKTTGITETIFLHNSITYRMFDVGGQRSERRKWIHCFENVTAVLFLAAISGYDQGLIEDRDSNQMQEAIMLFDSICNSTWFVKASMILFLNKIDVFREKILTSPVSRYFPDYKGPEGDLNATREFFKTKFMKLNRTATKDVYCQFTTAIDTTLLRVVMVSVQDTILQKNLAAIAF